MTHKVCLIGSGNMASTMAIIVAENIKKLPNFDPTLRMYTYDEPVNCDGEQMSIVDVINTRHENVKYLPGFKLPTNVVAVPDVSETCEGSDYVIFCTPHQFLNPMLPKMKGRLAEGATGITLIKGVTFKGDSIEMITETVERELGIKMGALMGANIATDIAKGDFCESTIAFRDRALGERWSPIFDTPTFRMKVITDVILQQLCGTLKNIVATGVGFIEGLGYGESTKAAFIRIGMEETFKFAQWYFPDQGCQFETLLESCGVADFIATAYGGRNARCAAEFVKSGKDMEEVEALILNGQKLQGVVAAREIVDLLLLRNKVQDYPLMCTVHMIATKQVPPKAILEYDGDHLTLIK